MGGRVADKKINMAAKNDSGGQGPAFVPPAQTGASTSLSAPVGAILIADDNPDDALYTKKIVEKLLLPFPVHAVLSGEEVFAYLEGRGAYESRAAYPYPILLLLDLRMPGVDGYEVLKWLETRREHRALPVVVLSVVRELAVVSRAYLLGARSFLVKPLTLDDLRMTLQALGILRDPDPLSGERKVSGPSLRNLPETGPPASGGTAPQGPAD